MTEALLLTLTTLAVTFPFDTFDVQTEVQANYDEISQATLQFVTASDVDLFHSVLYTADWAFVDATGHRQTWAQVRERAIQALSEPRLDSMKQRIQKVSLEPGGVTAVVNMTTVRAIVDAEGRYGRKGAPHTLTETTMFRDRWVRVSEEWLQKSREQIGAPTVSVDKPAWMT
jgi:ketosteroid isomerase-like protein